MNKKSSFHIPRKKIIEFCRRNHIQRMALFGSVLRDDFLSDSDIDVLVEFEPGHTPGLSFFGLEDELREIFSRDVDLLTFKAVQTSRNPIRRNSILNSARVIYGKG